MKESIIFWLAGPPVCCKGVFDAVSDVWDGKIYYVCTSKINNERSKITDGIYKNSDNKTEYIFIENNTEQGVKFLNEHINDIHVFNGYQSTSSQYLEKLLKLNKKPKIYIWAERTAYKSVANHSKVAISITNVLLNIKHSYYAYKYRNRVLGFFPLGKKGVQAYNKIGWKKENMFPFLYLPVMNEHIAFDDSESVSDKVRFVYLGRFSSGSKGTDILIDAFKKIKNSNYSLTMVGGYGNYKDQTMEFIESNPHVDFGGTWPINEACDRLSKYDVCLVPSRSEGWNPTVNEALMAGIGCIATDESVSDELITASEAGIVVKPDADNLASGIDYVLEHPELVLQWKKAAYEFRDNMTAKVCAQYFVDCIEYTLGTINKRPCPPWE